MEAYFDNSATTKPRQEVVETILDALTLHYGNPSSLHRKGVEVEKRIKGARKSVAKLMAAKETEIVFTSGGTESNNMAILGTVLANQRKGNKIITTRIEHPSVLNVFKYLETKGFEVSYIDVDMHGKVQMEQLEQSIDENTILISMMHVNNEVGTVQPVETIGKMITKLKNKPIFHVDGVQSFGKLKILPGKLGMDLFSVSAHKFHGPKGIGALYIKRGTKLIPTFYGGGQEIGARPGTENVSGILGLGTAAELVGKELDENIEKMCLLRKHLLNGIVTEIKDIKVNGASIEESAPHILNVSFLGIRGEILLHSLEQDNIYVSTGSACSSKKSNHSHVLKAMGLTEKEIEGAIRFSLSYSNTFEEVGYVVERLKKHVVELRKIMMR
ncbi:MAG: cysteine desulfurase family protein [Thermotaleaceae bacterium]